MALQKMSNTFKGLGMMELNSKGLGERIHHVRRFWGTQTKEYNWLKHTYETFLMDVGLEGNVIARNYATLGYLAEHSWWKHTWHLCHLFECELIIDSECLPQKQRGDDCAIMELFLN